MRRQLVNRIAYSRRRVEAVEVDSGLRGAKRGSLIDRLAVLEQIGAWAEPECVADLVERFVLSMLHIAIRLDCARSGWTTRQRLGP